MGHDRTSFKISTIRHSGDQINTAVNTWGDAVGEVNNAWLPVFALGIAGEDARVGYEEIRNDAIERLPDPYRSFNVNLVLHESASGTSSRWSSTGMRG